MVLSDRSFSNYLSLVYITSGNDKDWLVKLLGSVNDQINDLGEVSLKYCCETPIEGVNFAEHIQYLPRRADIRFRIHEKKRVAIEQCQSKYVLVLHDRIVPTPGAIKLIVEELKASNPDYLTPRVVAPTIGLRSLGPFRLKLDDTESLSSALKLGHRLTERIHIFNENIIVKTEGLNGAIFVIKRDLSHLIDIRFCWFEREDEVLSWTLRSHNGIYFGPALFHTVNSSKSIPIPSECDVMTFAFFYIKLLFSEFLARQLYKCRSIHNWVIYMYMRKQHFNKKRLRSCVILSTFDKFSKLDILPSTKPSSPIVHFIDKYHKITATGLYSISLESVLAYISARSGEELMLHSLKKTKFGWSLSYSREGFCTTWF